MILSNGYLVMKTVNEDKKSVSMVEEMHSELQGLLVDVRKKRAFSPSKWVNKKVDALNQYAKASGIAGCVVNLSGGLILPSLSPCFPAQRQQKTHPSQESLE